MGPSGRTALHGCRFKEDRRDLIIVDTSGRHKQSEALFEEMRAVAEAVAPDLVVFVMDSSIGQAAHDQAAAFRSSVKARPPPRPAPPRRGGGWSRTCTLRNHRASESCIEVCAMLSEGIDLVHPLRAVA